LYGRCPRSKELRPLRGAYGVLASGSPRSLAIGQYGQAQPAREVTRELPNDCSCPLTNSPLAPPLKPMLN